MAVDLTNLSTASPAAGCGQRPPAAIDGLVEHGTIALRRYENSAENRIEAGECPFGYATEPETRMELGPCIPLLTNPHPFPLHNRLGRLLIQFLPPGNKWDGHVARETPRSYVSVYEEYHQKNAAHDEDWPAPALSPCESLQAPSHSNWQAGAQLAISRRAEASAGARRSRKIAWQPIRRDNDSPVRRRDSPGGLRLSVSQAPSSWPWARGEAPNIGIAPRPPFARFCR